MEKSHWLFVEGTQGDANFLNMEKLVYFWSEQERLFDMSSHSYHDRVEKERTAAHEIPGEYAICYS